ncbi:ornithine carbamoyltransferase [Psychrosphaera sp. F3M07]|uniref:ornithine carbamoyltransferase n=1 Tax=Psychrosphaera sp. F3M07 TaxID=2841560 RepID=UPI001C0940B1|nr:ornithine carbamoyltransferase [Psychrosphaera sp. F3M07]MBU2916422.1 ornithine carbamoyltransferase [Psychrosphaera sp. F3M07]
MTLYNQSVLGDLDISPQQLKDILLLAIDMKATPEKYGDALKGKSIATLYEKPSLRTRVSFDVGINKLGGHAVYLDQQNGAMGKREDVADFGANLSCWCDAIVARVMTHATLTTLKSAASVPIVNSLCDLYHPCQALADYMTLQELFGEVKGLTLAYIGDGNNVTHSLMLAGAQLGVNLVVLTPEGYGVDEQIVQQATKIADENQCTVTVTNDVNALGNVDAIYADTWISMGDDKSLEQILGTFKPYQITKELMQSANAKYFMHCQPAHRDEEVTADVLDSEQSVILRQAENRMWAQNALLHSILVK